MPYLEQTATEINNVLKSTAFKDARFKGGRFEAIATQVMVSEEKALPIVYENGDYRDVVFDDRYPVSVYHRVQSNTYSFDATKDFGRDKKLQKCTSVMLMCVMAFRDQIKISKEQLEMLLVSNFPLGNTPNFMTDSLQTNTISVLDSDMDSLRVYQNEFKGLEIKLTQERIIFSIRYKIESSWFTGCFDMCNCN